MADAELLWRWANDPETRRNSFTRTPIPYPDHRTWLAERLASETTRLWIFEDGGDPVGQVRVDAAGDVAEIHIAVAPDRRGRGYGTRILAEAVHRFREENGRARLQASVLEHNVASLKLFGACGFREVARTTGPERAIVLELAAAPAAGHGGERVTEATGPWRP